MHDTHFNDIPMDSLSTDGLLDSPSPAAAATPQSRTPESRSRRGLRTGLWILFALVSFVTFTILKLPTERLEATATQQINDGMQSAGLTFAVQKARVSIGLGITYEAEGVSIGSTSSPDAAPARFDRITLKPSLFWFALGYLSARFHIVQRDEATLSGSITIPNPSAAAKAEAKAEPGAAPTQKASSVSLQLTDFNPIRAYPLGGDAITSKIQLKATGSLNFNGVPSDPGTWSGNIDLGAPSLAIGESSYMGMATPGLKINTVSIKGRLDSGSKKLVLQEFILGKTGGTDDIAATLTGDVTLTSAVSLSALNLTAKYRIQGTLKERLGPMLMLLDKFKKEDGSYTTLIKGTVSRAEFQ
jgi:type II secretion system protein N